MNGDDILKVTEHWETAMRRHKGITTIETILLIAVLVIGAMVAAAFLMRQYKTSGRQVAQAIDQVTGKGVEQVQELTQPGAGAASSSEIAYESGDHTVVPGATPPGSVGAAAVVPPGGSLPISMSPKGNTGGSAGLGQAGNDGSGAVGSGDSAGTILAPDAPDASGMSLSGEQRLFDGSLLGEQGNIDVGSEDGLGRLQATVADAHAGYDYEAGFNSEKMELTLRAGGNAEFTAASIDYTKRFGDFGTVDAKVVVGQVKGSVEGSAKVGPDGIDAKVSAGVEATLAKVEVNAGGSYSFLGLFDIDASARGEGAISAQANAEGYFQADKDGFRIGGSIGAAIGLGGKVGGDIAIRPKWDAIGALVNKNLAALDQSGTLGNLAVGLMQDGWSGNLNADSAADRTIAAGKDYAVKEYINPQLPEQYRFKDGSELNQAGVTERARQASKDVVLKYLNAKVDPRSPGGDLLHDVVTGTIDDAFDGSLSRASLGQRLDQSARNTAVKHYLNPQLPEQYKFADGSQLTKAGVAERGSRYMRDQAEQGKQKLLDYLNGVRRAGI